MQGVRSQRLVALAPPQDGGSAGRRVRGALEVGRAPLGPFFLSKCLVPDASVHWHALATHVRPMLVQSSHAAPPPPQAVSWFP
jgi:hypothetical protein